MRALAVAMVVLPVASGAAAFRNPLSPNQCAWTGGCYVTAYFDLNRTAGPVQDWACGSHTYDNHTGVDIGIGGFAGMNQGRDVHAAADGVVTGAHDGEFDQCTSGACGAANYVWIKHADGKVSLYYHLKKNSVAVSVGQVVTCGQVIGQVGSSGYSTGPHLHFQVNAAAGNSNSYDDPFAGINASCGGPLSWWVSQGGYKGLPAYACEPKPLPDVVVTNVSFTPANPRAGDAVQLQATVTNSGQSGTGQDVGVGFFVDGQPIGFGIRGPMAAGQTETLQANMTWTATSGQHTFEAFVDDVNRFAESNEGNNKATAAATVLALAELSVPELLVTPAAPVEDEPVTFAAVVRNAGGPVGAGAVLRLTLDDAEPVDVAVPALAEGESATVTFDVPWTALPGEHLVRVVINPDAQVKESDGTNNLHELPLAVLYADRDLDGSRRDADCDDANPQLHPLAQESCDGVDTNCDGVVDDPAACVAPGKEGPTSKEPGAEGLPPVTGSCGCTGTGAEGFVPLGLGLALFALRRRGLTARSPST